MWRAKAAYREMPDGEGPNHELSDSEDDSSMTSNQFPDGEDGYITSDQDNVDRGSLRDRRAGAGDGRARSSAGSSDKDRRQPRYVDEMGDESPRLKMGSVGSRAWAVFWAYFHATTALLAVFVKDDFIQVQPHLEALGIPEALGKFIKVSQDMVMLKNEDY
jgi:hypothetical protein